MYNCLFTWYVNLGAMEKKSEMGRGTYGQKYKNQKNAKKECEKGKKYKKWKISEKCGEYAIFLQSLVNIEILLIGVMIFKKIFSKNLSF